MNSIWIIIVGIIIGIIFYLYDKDGFDLKLNNNASKIFEGFKKITQQINLSSIIGSIMLVVFIIFIIPAMFPEEVSWFTKQKNWFIILCFFLFCLLGAILLPGDKKEENKKEDNHGDGHH